MAMNVATRHEIVQQTPALCPVNARGLDHLRIHTVQARQVQDHVIGSFRPKPCDDHTKRCLVFAGQNRWQLET